MKFTFIWFGSNVSIYVNCHLLRTQDKIQCKSKAVVSYLVSDVNRSKRQVVALLNNWLVCWASFLIPREIRQNCPFIRLNAFKSKLKTHLILHSRGNVPQRMLWTLKRVACWRLVPLSSVTSSPMLTRIWRYAGSEFSVRYSAPFCAMSVTTKPPYASSFCPSVTPTKSAYFHPF